MSSISTGSNVVFVGNFPAPTTSQQDTNSIMQIVVYRLEQLIGVVARDAPNSAQRDIPMWDIPDEGDGGTDIVNSPAVLD